MNTSATTPSETLTTGGPPEDAVIYRGYCAEDAPELAELINRGFGITQGLNHWNWKFHDNPSGEALSCVVEHQGRIVAHFGGLPTRFRIQGTERLGVQDVDDYVEADLRTFRGAAQLNRCRTQLNREARADFLFGFAIEVTSRVSQTQFGYERVAQIPRLMAVLDYGPLLERRRLTRPLARSANVINRFRRTAEVPDPTPPYGTHIEEIGRFDARFDRFWDYVKDDYPVTVVRDADHLNWRYADIPEVQTTAFALVDETFGDVHGYIVLSEYRDGEIKRGRIVDFLTSRTEDDGQAATALLGRAFEHFREQGTPVVVCWMFAHCHLRHPLIQAGFCPRRRRGREIVFRNSDLKNPALSSALMTSRENWFLTMGDSDMT